MAISYHDATSGFVIVPDECPDCGGPRYDTGCDAPGCHAAAFPCCGTGCDIEFEGGRCATALAEEDEPDRAERIDRERAAFGLTRRPDEQDGDRDE